MQTSFRYNIICYPQLHLYIYYYYYMRRRLYIDNNIIILCYSVEKYTLRYINDPKSFSRTWRCYRRDIIS